MFVFTWKYQSVIRFVLIIIPFTKSNFRFRLYTKVALVAGQLDMRGRAIAEPAMDSVSDCE